ncbi:hypothetical protein [Muribaculum intestinale]|uniref:hypothetical protein n=1 Tax=Muribaculum intestinale TaxID=1796646 RepID=UPI0025A946A5|nr:hypothetical protein [Muribaculum intestinale]
MNSNFMYGLGPVKYKGKPIGYIAKGSFDMGGAKPESSDIEAEQVPGAPVLVIPQSNGKIAPKFDMIQLNFESLHLLLGGALVKIGEKITGWTAPRAAIVMDGPWEIALVSGQSILIPSATLLSDLAGKLTLTETAKIEVELKVTAPATEGVPPYGVFATDSLPETWKEEGKWQLPVPPASAE